MTIKLFEKDVYLKQVTVRIIEKFEKDDRKIIVLDQTIFFPTGGGQPCDLGTIDTSKVLDVFEKDAIIYHEVDCFPKADSVECRIDWERRFDHMQQHCGEHMLSGLFLSEFGVRNKGFHLGDDYVAVDMDINELTEEMVDTIELKVNQAIWENHPIKIETVMTSNEAKDFALRKIPEIEENIRIVHIDTIDSVACCGTHPYFSGEVGLMKIIKWQKYKGMTRVFFYCGRRAFSDYQAKHHITSKLNRTFSSELVTLMEKIERETQKKQQLSEENRTLRKKISSFEAHQLMEDRELQQITHMYEEESFESLQYIGTHIAESHSGFVVLLASKSSKSILFMQGGEVDIDCGKLLKGWLSDEMFLNKGKGGGGMLKAQATFEDLEILEIFYTYVELNIRKFEQH